MLEKIASYVEKHHMLSKGDVVAAGVSGGADSVCLLLVLCELKKKIPFRLTVVHVNHMLRAEADGDAAFVAGLCKDLSLPCHIVKADVAALAAKEGISLEEAGRKIRYKAFRDILRREDGDAVRECRAKIAVAHNQNDRAETMLFNLFRGSGLEGLCGIKPTRGDEDGITVIRPLLDTSREEIEEYLREKKTGWREDITNSGDDYTRNRIRHHILPCAENEIAGGAVRNMGRAADILEENADFVRRETLLAYDRCSEEGELPVLSVEKVCALHPFMERQLILYCLEKMTPKRKDITEKHVEEVMSLFEKEGNREVHLPYGIIARREYGRVLFECGNEESEPAAEALRVSLPAPGEGAVKVQLSDRKTLEFSVFAYQKEGDIPKNQYTKWFDYDKIDTTSKKELEIRTRRSGDFLCIDDKNARKSLQDYMVNEKIPKRERDKIPLLAKDSHILWVTGYRISTYYRIDGNTKYVLQVQLGGGQ